MISLDPCFLIQYQREIDMQDPILNQNSPSSLPQLDKALGSNQEAKYSQEMVAGIPGMSDKKEEKEFNEADLLLELQWHGALLQLATFEVETKIDNSLLIDMDVFNEFFARRKSLV